MGRRLALPALSARTRTTTTPSACTSIILLVEPFRPFSLTDLVTLSPGSASSTTAPTSTVSVPTSTASGTSSAPSSTSTAAAGNPFEGYEIFASPYYAAEVAAAAANITDSTLAGKAASVANIPTFTWFDQVAKVPTLGTYLANATALQTSSGNKQIVPIVVYDLPDRDCAVS